MIAFADSLLIWLYRITGNPILDYFLGTFLLCFLAVLVGEITISLVFKANKAHLAQLNDEVERMSRLSREAESQGDEGAYRAINKQGNEVFGRLFFNRFGLGAASIWPIFLALAWMQTRFQDIDLPLPWVSWKINYVVFFLLNYIPARVLLGRLKRRLPYYKGIHDALINYKRLESYRKASEANRNIG